MRDIVKQQEAEIEVVAWLEELGFVIDLEDPMNTKVSWEN